MGINEQFSGAILQWHNLEKIVLTRFNTIDNVPKSQCEPIAS